MPLSRPWQALRHHALAAGIALLALAAVYALYARVLPAPLFFDDELITREGFRAEYGQLLTARVRVIAYHSIVALERFFGDQHIPFQRAVNVALHALVAALLFVFYRRLLDALGAPLQSATDFSSTAATSPAALPVGRWATFLCASLALVFLLHPVAVYAVAYLVQRSILLCTLFSLLALLATIGWAQYGGALRLIGAFACYGLALLSKEYALALPAAMFGLIIIIRRLPPVQVLRALAPLALLSLLAGVFLWRKYGQFIGQPFDQTSLGYVAQLAQLEPGIEKRIWPLSIANEMRLFFHYGALWLVPNVAAMSVDLRPRFPLHFDDLGLLLGVAGYVLLLGAAAVGVFSSLPRRRLLAWALLTVTTLYVTEFATVWIQDPFVLYRSYLWAMALPGVALALAPASAPERTGARVALAALALVLLGGLASLARDRIESMRSPLALWSDAVAKLPEALTPGQSRPYFNRGAAYRDEGRMQLALRDFEQSTRLGDGGEGLFATAEWLVATGRSTQALQALAGALARGMDGAVVLINAGALFEAQGQPELALRAYSRAIEAPRAAPEFVAEARAKRALLSFALGRPSPEAFADVEQALQLAPRSFTSRLAEAYARLARGEAALAREHFERLHAERRSLPTAAGLLQSLKAAGDSEAARQQLEAHAGLTDEQDRRALAELAARLGLSRR